MSSDTLEGILFALQSNPELAAAYRVKPDALLERYPLSDAERRVLLDWNVRAMAHLGVNSLLLMGAYQAVFGHAATPEYIQKMRAPPSDLPGATQGRG